MVFTVWPLLTCSNVWHSDPAVASLLPKPWLILSSWSTEALEEEKRQLLLLPSPSSHRCQLYKLTSWETLVRFEETVVSTIKYVVLKIFDSTLCIYTKCGCCWVLLLKTWILFCWKLDDTIMSTFKLMSWFMLFYSKLFCSRLVYEDLYFLLFLWRYLWCNHCNSLHLYLCFVDILYKIFFYMSYNVHSRSISINNYLSNLPLHLNATPSITDGR